MRDRTQRGQHGTLLSWAWRGGRTCGGMMARWVPVALLAGLLYAAVGIGFAIPTTHVHFWRLAAWIVSGIAYAAHAAYEHFRLRHSARDGALHMAAAAAFGTFGLAVGANVHSLLTGAGAEHRYLLLIALVAWPAIVAIPAFLVGLALLTGLSRALPKSVRPLH